MPLHRALQEALLSVQVMHDARSCTFGSCSLCLVDCVWAILIVVCVFLLCCGHLDAALTVSVPRA